MLFKVEFAAFGLVGAVTVFVHKTVHLSQYSRVLMLALWGVFFLFFLASLDYRYRSAGVGGLLCCSILILAGTLIPGDLKMLCYHKIMAFVPWIEIGRGGVQASTIFGTSHFVLFTLLGFMFVRGKKNNSIWYVGCHILMLAAGTELAQLFVRGRWGRVEDFSIDCFGALLGMLCGGLWVWMRDMKLKSPTSL